MKIGILTLPIETGYGSIMQAFALKTALQQRGHEVIFIKRLRKKHLGVKRIIRRFVKKYILGKRSTIIFIDKKERVEYPIITQNTQPFINIHIAPFTSPYYTSKQMKQVNDMDIDAIVVGSDQVWRPNCVDNIEDYFLYQISDRIKKYSYAASLGIDDWTFSKKETEICSEAVRRFQKTSVREISGVNLCKMHLGICPAFVVDPTLLHDKQFYSNLIGGQHDPQKEHKINAFILDRNEKKFNSLKKLVASTGKDYFYAANNTEDRQALFKDRIAPTVESWLDSFNSADIIFTDSFHGCAFSIIFRKDFYVFINKDRGIGRFRSLLGLFGLEHRIIDENTDINAVQPINWNYVEKRLKQMQDFSNFFLDKIK